MSSTEQKLQVALYVDDFLPYTHSWIYRQVSDPVTCVKTVLCHRRSEEHAFPWARYVSTESDVSGWKEYIRGRFWFLFKHQAPHLNKREEAIFTKELTTQGIHLVHAHFGTNGVLIAPVCKRLNIPLVVTFHGFDISSAPLRWPAYHEKLKLLFEQISSALVISEDMALRLEKMGCPKEKIQVSYLGVPLSDFPFIDRSSHTGPLVFLHAGRLTAKKGVPDLVRAFAKAFPRRGDAELWLAGEGEEQRQVEKAITSCKPAGIVKVLGRLSDEELLKVRKEADVFVINCRTDRAGTTEGLPISILEACAMGMPVISTLHAGIPEAVKPYETGILVEEFDNDSLAQAMQQMSDKALRTAMGVRARAYMQEKYALEFCNKKLSTLYLSALTN